MKKILCSNWLAWQERWAYLNCPIGMSCVGPARKKVIRCWSYSFCYGSIDFEDQNIANDTFTISVQCVAMLVLLLHEFVFQYVLKKHIGRLGRFKSKILKSKISFGRI